MPRIRFFLILASLVAGAALATRGTPDPVVNLESLTELWSDTLRDTDQIGMKATRVSDADEMRIGADLARGVSDVGPEDPAAEAYVRAVGEIVARHVSRPGIHYQFHVVHSAAINAFALPGGQIFVTSGMLNFVQSEAELAAILGHEISHVDLRHCIERYQYETKLRKAGMPEVGQAVEMAHRLATFPFARYQESDADAQGLRLSIESGYDPAAAAGLFQRMQTHLGERPRTPATTPAGEVVQSAEGALVSFFRSHPPSEDRIRNLNAMVARERPALKDKSFYVGRQNLAERVARSAREYPGEYRGFR
jgi:beta-barrel assembly-enhancing protease